MRKQDKYRDERRAVLVRVSPLRWSRLFGQLAKYRETAETAMNLMNKKGKKQKRKELDAKAILEEVRLLVCRSVVCHTHTHTHTPHTRTPYGVSPPYGYSPAMASQPYGFSCVPAAFLSVGLSVYVRRTASRLGAVRGGAS